MDDFERIKDYLKILFIGKCINYVGLGRKGLLFKFS